MVQRKLVIVFHVGGPGFINTKITHPQTSNNITYYITLILFITVCYFLNMLTNQ